MPSNTGFDASGAVFGCNCIDCQRIRSQFANAMTLGDVLQDALQDIQAAPVSPAPAAEELPAVDPDAHCAHCGAALDGNNPPVLAVYSRDHTRDTAEYGSACCVDSGCVQLATCYESHLLCRRRVMFYVADLDAYVHRYYMSDYYYCRASDEYYSDREAAPDYQTDPEVEDNGLLYYSTNVMDHCNYDEPARRLVMGVELEMESSGHTSVDRMVRKIGGPIQQRYILKSDGSLNDGIELVTVPMTLAQHSAKLPTDFDWETALLPFRRAGFISGSTTTCGIHVHVNRRALSALTIGKLLVFLNSPRAETRAFVTNVAQRKPTGYCARNPKSVRDGKNTSSDKYDALHLLPRTIEFRIFRGNMRPERILKNLEFVHALCTYMPSCSVANVENVQAFLSWLYDNRKQYPNLHAFILERNAQPAVLRAQDEDDLRETLDAEAA